MDFAHFNKFLDNRVNEMIGKVDVDIITQRKLAEVSGTDTMITTPLGDLVTGKLLSRLAIDYTKQCNIEGLSDPDFFKAPRQELCRSIGSLGGAIVLDKPVVSRPILMLGLVALTNPETVKEVIADCERGQDVQTQESINQDT